MSPELEALVIDVRSMLSAPFVGSVDLIHLFLLIGAVLVMTAIWLMILHHIRMAAGSL